MIKTDIRGFAWLDYSRFLAAMGVVLFHYVTLGIANGSIQSFSPFPYLSAAAAYGYLGVDLFFIISGFVITISAERKSAGDFAVSRFVRLWPTFFLCMTLTAIVRMIYAGNPDGLTATDYVANLTMFPRHIGFTPMDEVYWTLAFEIMFYSMVFIIVAIGQFHRFETIVKVWLLGIIGTYFAGVNIIIFSYYFALFAAGCLFSIIHSKGVTWSRLLFLLAAFAFSTMTAMERAEAKTLNDMFDVMPTVVALIYLAFFGLFTFFIAVPSANISLPFSRMIGLITYPLYLLHNEIGLVILDEWGSESKKALVVIVTTLAMIALSAAVVQFWEKPLKKIWTGAARSVVDRIPILSKKPATS